MAQQALIPEKRGGISGLMNMFSQGSGLLQMGAKGKEGYASLMGGGSTGGGAEGVVGGGAGSYSLGVGNVTPVTQGMSPTLGGGSTGGSTATGAGFGETVAGYAPYAAPAIAGYYEYQAMKDPSKLSKYVGNRDVSFTGKKLGEKIGTAKMPTISSGLSLTGESGGNKMSAVERRYQNSQNAMSSIDEAQKALSEAQLPDAERRSIYQKLELARQGGQKRGSSIHT